MQHSIALRVYDNLAVLRPLTKKMILSFLLQKTIFSDIKKEGGSLSE